MTVMNGPGKCRRWEPTELAVTLLSKGALQVVRQWISCAAFLDHHDDPMMLAMAGGSEGGFIRLVYRANRELPPAVILKELLGKGIVEQHVSGKLLLRRIAYVPSQPRRKSATRVQPGAVIAPPFRRRRHTDFA